jgi:DNA-binding response OmpR family regulator
MQAKPPILYVEDEENDAVLLGLAFRRAKVQFPLAVVSDGRQAVEYLWGEGRFADRARHPLPCLLILDLNLPLMGGFEVLARVRAETRFASLPVLVFTSSAQESDRFRARELGASDYIVKPPQIERLVMFAESLERWVSGGETSNP